MDVKRLVCLLVAFVLCLSACTNNTGSVERIEYTDSTETIEYIEYTHAVYRINITAECISNDSVGNEWERTFSMDGQEILSGAQITLPLGEPPITKTITATIKECDKLPDIASQDITFVVMDGESKTAMITVTEDGGCYKGNTAVWEVAVLVELVKTIKEQL